MKFELECLLEQSYKNSTVPTGGTVSREAGPVKGGTTEIAFVKDPTGYSWEIIQRKDQNIREPIAQVRASYILVQMSNFLHGTKNVVHFFKFYCSCTAS